MKPSAPLTQDASAQDASETAAALVSALRGQLIVSCQAPPGDPLRDTATMVRMARAAQAGGAVAIRANGPDDVAAIAAAVPLPLIGLWKDGDQGVYITPTVRHAMAVRAAGAAVVAADATDRPRPDGSTFADLVAAVHADGGLVMADISTAAEGIAAQRSGADLLSTTLSGYVPGQHRGSGPDLGLVAELAGRTDLPVIAEGRIGTPDEAAEALRRGAHAVVVGTAITAPGAITARFTAALAPDAR
ncbi:N-acetylmannosamine-6-phosphate 2-epimerase [Streptomyces sp. NRRL F-5126]|uniref:N-acetylmannosamine-6-phosphate 2-epimerase n=1 Tax=Streptomyces sp. NRRL F-5126 TaxID=1463857 RepID=UPI00099B4AE8|nr:N-acetylmannosamine-6-phosphate 2-epimerase [Streptomyces sp. NRRL F-5126]